MIVRSGRNLVTLAPELRRAAAQFSPYVPVRDLRSMSSRIRVVRTAPRFQMLLLGSFAMVALLLAAVGLYGSLAHAVGRRTREMGIRMALGAPRLGIFRLVLNQGMTVTVAGLAFGLAGAFLLTRFLRSFLFEVEALDLMSFAGAAVVLLLAAAFAIVVPASRATGVDVVGSLRVAARGPQGIRRRAARLRIGPLGGGGESWRRRVGLPSGRAGKVALDSAGTIPFTRTAQECRLIFLEPMRCELERPAILSHRADHVVRHTIWNIRHRRCRTKYDPRSNR